MIRKFIIATALIVCIFAANVPAVYANDVVTVTIDGQRVAFPEQQPTVVDGRALVPVREVFEVLGFYVDFDENNRIAILENDYYLVRIPVGSTVFTTNGVNHTLDVPAQFINGETMLPIRAVLESIGLFVGWEDATRTVLIRTTAVALPTIPNRRLTNAELDSWIVAYSFQGENAFELEVIRLVNVERQREGLHPLQLENTLAMAARFKAQSMQNLNYFSHRNPVYGNWGVLMEVFDFKEFIMGENIAHLFRTPEAVVNGWMNSPTHRYNIMHPRFHYIGVGFYDYFWVQMFSGY